MFLDSSTTDMQSYIGCVVYFLELFVDVLYKIYLEIHPIQCNLITTLHSVKPACMRRMSNSYTEIV